MLKKSIFLFFFFVSIIHSYTIKQLNNPTSTVFDITKDPTTIEPSIPMIMTEVGKITINIDRVIAMYPREVAKFQCLTDQYGTDYCPEALAPADTYWDYADGYSVANIGSVVDYTNKITTTKEVCSTNTGVRMYSNCAGTMNYSQASSYCSNLVEGGYNDWRLPTLGETATSSGMGGNGVPSCSGRTWTSTVYDFDGLRYVWSGSSVSHDSIYSFHIRVRCVR